MSPLLALEASSNQDVKMKVLARLVPSEGCEEELSPWPTDGRLSHCLHVILPLRGVSLHKFPLLIRIPATLD